MVKNIFSTNLKTTFELGPEIKIPILVTGSQITLDSTLVDSRIFTVNISLN